MSLAEQNSGVLVGTTEFTKRRMTNVVGGVKSLLRKALSISEQPYSRELVPETIFIDDKLDGQLVIPGYAPIFAKKETIIH